MPSRSGAPWRKYYGVGETYGSNPYGGAPWGEGDPYDAASASTKTQTAPVQTGVKSGDGQGQKDGGEWGGLSYGQWAQLLIGLYSANRNSRPGQWRQLPEDPAQRALREQILRYMQPGGSPTRGMLGNMLAPRVEQLGQNAPQGMTPPKYDLEAILGGIDRGTPPAQVREQRPGDPPRGGRPGERPGQGGGLPNEQFNLPSQEEIFGNGPIDSRRAVEWLTNNRQWLQVLGGAIGGAPGAAIGRVAAWLVNYYANRNPSLPHNPNQVYGPNGAWTPTPGMMTPAGQPGAPAPRENWGPNWMQEIGAGFIADQNRGLMDGGDPRRPSQGSRTHPTGFRY